MVKIIYRVSFTPKVWVIHLLAGTAVNMRSSYINMIYTLLFFNIYLIFFVKDKKSSIIPRGVNKK